VKGELAVVVVGSIPCQSGAVSGHGLRECLDAFSNAQIDRREAQVQISSMTEIILQQRFRAFASERVLLVPVLRAGAAMWLAANRFFGEPACAFAVAAKHKGTSETAVTLSTVSGSSRCQVIVLDPVVATGDTICAVTKLIAAELPESEIHVVACYGSPEAVENIDRNAKATSLTIGLLAKTVDQSGYLVPKINGDCGEKLFGRRLVS
jgi:uracil phosphoribosyltransferase